MHVLRTWTAHHNGAITSYDRPLLTVEHVRQKTVRLAPQLTPACVGDASESCLSWRINLQLLAGAWKIDRGRESIGEVLLYKRLCSITSITSTTLDTAVSTALATRRAEQKLKTCLQGRLIGSDAWRPSKSIHKPFIGPLFHRDGPFLIARICTLSFVFQSCHVDLSSEQQTIICNQLVLRDFWDI